MALYADLIAASFFCGVWSEFRVNYVGISDGSELRLQSPSSFTVPGPFCLAISLSIIKEAQSFTHIQ